jgi:hypothetical protein
MHTSTLALLLLTLGLCHAIELTGYIQFEGNRSSPKHVSQEVRDKLEQADASPNSSHTVSFTSPGYGDWDWTLQLSDVSVPTISNSTPDAHVAFTTWHFSRAGETPRRADRPQDWPFCAYLMSFNFPHNVSSQWDPDNSSCVPALGEQCASAIRSVVMTDNCESDNAVLSLRDQDACAGMLSGGPRPSPGQSYQGYGTSDPRC